MKERRNCFLIVIMLVFISVNMVCVENCDSLITNCSNNLPNNVETNNIDWSNIIVAVLGSFFAALIALWSINKTNNNNVILEEKRRKGIEESNKQIYCGLLHSIFHIIPRYDNLLTILQKEIEAYKELIEIEFQIVEKPFNLMQTQILQDMLSQLYKYDNLSTILLPKIADYIMLLNHLNENLNLKRIVESIQSLEKQNSAKILFNSTLKSLSNILEKINILSNELKTELTQEIEFLCKSKSK